MKPPPCNGQAADYICPLRESCCGEAMMVLANANICDFGWKARYFALDAPYGGSPRTLPGHDASGRDRPRPGCADRVDGLLDQVEGLIDRRSCGAGVLSARCALPNVHALCVDWSAESGVAFIS